MFELLLVSLAVAFLLALFSFPIEVASMYMPPVAVNAFFSITLSVLSNLLINVSFKEYVLRVFATAFLSRVLLAVAEKMTDYRPAVVNSARE